MKKLVKSQIELFLSTSFYSCLKHTVTFVEKAIANPEVQFLQRELRMTPG